MTWSAAGGDNNLLVASVFFYLFLGSYLVLGLAVTFTRARRKRMAARAAWERSLERRQDGTAEPTDSTPDGGA